MRDGTITIQGPVSDFTREDLVKGLLPPNTEEAQGPGHTSAAPVDYTASPVLELQDFSGYGFSDVSLKVYPGEILGVAGVVGAGRTEMATTIFGMDKVLGGKVLLNGQDITGRKTQQVIRAGLNYVPEDRHLNGLFKICDVAANTTSANLFSSYMGRFLLNRRSERETTQKYVENFRTKVTTSLPAVCPAATSKKSSLAAACPPPPRSWCWTNPPAASTPPPAATCTASFTSSGSRGCPCF